MRRRVTIVVFAIAACLAATIGLRGDTHRVTPPDDGRATSQLAAIAPAAPAVSPRDVENKAGPLLALALVLVATAALTTWRRGLLHPRATHSTVRVASRGWSRRGPPQLLVFA